MKRFWDKVDKTGTCWNWTAGIRSKNTGYGAIKYKGVVYDAHRFVWFLTYGVFPTQWILHGCNNRLCVNPSHLREGTPKENYEDMLKDGKSQLYKAQVANRSKTECPQGHPYDIDNTAFRYVKGVYEGRACRTCKREGTRISMQNLRKKRDALLVKWQTR